MPDRRFRSVCHVRWRRSCQQSATEGQEFTAAPIHQKAEVPDAREAPREHMFEETAQKDLVSSQDLQFKRPNFR
jgi:hypothetical protein